MLAAEQDGYGCCAEHDGCCAELTDLDDDALLHMLKCSHDVSAIAAVARCSKHFSHLTSSDSLWKSLVQQAWPLLPPAEAASASWRAFHRARSLCLPSWRYYLVRMDEVEHLLSKLVCRSAHAMDLAQRNTACDRLAVNLIAIFCSQELFFSSSPAAENGLGVLDYEYGGAWARRLAEMVCRQTVTADGLVHAVCDELSGWTTDTREL